MAFDGLQFDIGANASQVYREFQTIAARAKSVASTMSGYFAAIGGGLLAGAGALGLALHQVIDTGSEMESLQSRLTTIMGSSVAAQERMGELFQFAVSTPFDLAGVVGAEVTLRGFGAAAEDVLPGLIDFAAGSKTELSQAAIDIGKAWNQGATGMESDGARILRSQMELRTGMDLTKMSIVDFRKELLTELNTGMFAGAGLALSKTMSGLIANLEDEWTRFKLAVADAGIFDNVKALLGEILQLIDQNRASLGQMAEIASGALWDGVKLLVLGLGEAADLTEAWGFVLAKTGGYLNGIAANFLEDWRVTALAAMDVADALGQKGIASSLFDAASGIAEIQGGMKRTRDNAYAWADGIDITNDKLATSRKLISDAEAAAAKFGTGASGELRPTGGAAPTGDPGAAAKDAELRQKWLEQEINDALDFADQMAGLRASETEQAKAQLDQQLADLEAFHAEGMLQGTLYTDTLTNIYRNYYDALGEIQADALKKQADADQKAAEAKRAAWMANLGAVGDIAGGISDLWASETGKQTAASKAAAHIQVGISEALGIMSGFEKGLVFGGLNAVAVGVAAIKAHSDINKAHQGRVFGMPDEVTMLRQEMGGIVNSQALRRYGPETVQAMNSGTWSGGPQVIEMRVNDTVQRAVIHQQLNGSTELNGAIRGASTSRAPGLSGRGARA